MAALIRWNPSSDLINLHSQMDQLFGELSEAWRSPQQRGGNVVSAAFLPVDIERTDDAIVIRASVPGFEPDEVDITVENGVLTIDAQHEEEDEQSEGDMIRRERYVGRLYRQIVLGDGVRGEEAEASFENGELVVRVPLEQKQQPRRVRVSGRSRRGKSDGNGSGAQADGQQSGQSGQSEQSGTAAQGEANLTGSAEQSGASGSTSGTPETAGSGASQSGAR
ncbi:MAG TPA: Hsp20/alpha crystallin family protein [Candidatus Dormibacteraeota bacterium]|jgi:HSP20 family protein|nr:Hsp20/alpha crystallin family protein [Candidatus Dormibacteraeota bacterium]